MTSRLLYVPQVGHAVCGSLGSRHCGQVTSTGAAAFHLARRDLVLLRDILRLGTATSALLRTGGIVRPGQSGVLDLRPWLLLAALITEQVFQHGPDAPVTAVAVAGLSIG